MRSIQPWTAGGVTEANQLSVKLHLKCIVFLVLIEEKGGRVLGLCKPCLD